MKRLLDSSKAITHQFVRSNSKSRRPYSPDTIKHDKKSSRLVGAVPISNYRRHVSIATLNDPDDGIVSDFSFTRHNMPERMNWYWNLDEDHKRKISHPIHVKQAVQDTFMQRAQGGYHYRRTGPLRNNNSSANSNQAGNQQKSEVSVKQPPSKPAKQPPPTEKIVPKPQVPRRKRFIDTAKPIQHYLRPRSQVDRKSRLGASLKEAGQRQLEEAKKKLYDPGPAVLDYLIEKHIPRDAALKFRGRKDKVAADSSQKSVPTPSIVQKVFGWKEREDTNKKSSDISITPRSIEVRKKWDRPTYSGRSGKREDRSVEKKAITRFRRKTKSEQLLKSLRGRSAKKAATERDKKKLKPVDEPKEETLRKTQADEDREAIWKKMKASSVPAVSEEIACVKKQVREFELKPQIYPKGSLSLRKSYLPIQACRPRSDIGRPMDTPSAVSYAKPDPKQPAHTEESPSITNHIMSSLRSIFSRMRRNSA